MSKSPSNAPRSIDSPFRGDPEKLGKLVEMLYGNSNVVSIHIIRGEIGSTPKLTVEYAVMDLIHQQAAIERQLNSAIEEFR